MASVLRRLRLTDDDGHTLRSVSLGEDIRFEIELAAKEVLPDVSIALHIYSALGQRVATCHSRYQSSEPIIVRGDTRVSCTVKKMSLLPGPYSVVVGVASAGDQIDRIDPALFLDVTPRDIYGTGRLPPPRDGVFAPEARWSVLKG
jgi:hypothetical protein